MVVRQLQTAQTFLVQKVHFNAKKKTPPLIYMLDALRPILRGSCAIYIQILVLNFDL